MQDVNQGIRLIRDFMRTKGLSKNQIIGQLGRDGENYGPRENTVLELNQIIEQAQVLGDETSVSAVDFRIFGGQARVYIRMTNGNWELNFMDPENEEGNRKNERK